MAYLPFKQQGQGQPTLGTPSMGSQQGAQGPGSYTSPVTQSGQQGTGFVNLQNYFDLNRQGAQGQANQLRGQQQNRERTAMQDMDGFYGDYSKAVQNGAANPTKVDMGVNPYVAATSGTPEPAESQKQGIPFGYAPGWFTPKPPAPAPAPVDTHWYANQYAGPADMYQFDPARYSKVAGEFAASDAGGQALKDPSRVGELLPNAPGYTSGQRGLDSFLVGSSLAKSPGHYDVYDPLGKGLTDYFNTQTNAGNTLASSAQARFAGQQPQKPPDPAGDSVNNVFGAVNKAVATKPPYGPASGEVGQSVNGTFDAINKYFQKR